MAKEELSTLSSSVLVSATLTPLLKISGNENASISQRYIITRSYSTQKVVPSSIQYYIPLVERKKASHPIPQSDRSACVRLNGHRRSLFSHISPFIIINPSGAREEAAVGIRLAKKNHRLGRRERGKGGGEPLIEWPDGPSSAAVRTHARTHRHVYP